MITQAKPHLYASKRKTRGLFAHSRLDALFVVLAVVQFSLLVYGVLSVGVVAWPVSVGLGLLQAFLIVTNYQSIAHNFLHNPFFRNKRLNDLFGVFNTLLIGAPHSIYRLHHLRHHKYNNDAPDPVTGRVNDHTSTYRFSPDGRNEEGFVKYSLLTYFRNDLAGHFREAYQKRTLLMAMVEMTVLGAMLAAFAWFNLPGLLFFYLPAWLLGNIAAMAENYFEHHGAIPGNRKTDSVSSYGKLYNLIWFNNGYHQEHHYRPQVHWTRLADVTELLPPETERRVVKGAHWFNLGPKSTEVRDRVLGAQVKEPVRQPRECKMQIAKCKLQIESESEAPQIHAAM
jgi:fatty acid desaturase